MAEAKAAEGSQFTQHSLVTHLFQNHQRGASWLLAFNVVLLALTAQLFRENYFGLFRPYQTSEPVSYDPCSTTILTCPVPDPRCALNGTLGFCSNTLVKVDPPTYDAVCDYSNVSFAPDLSAGSGCTLTGFACVAHRCVSISGATIDPCYGVVCPSQAPGQCQVDGSATCVNGACVFENVVDGTYCGPFSDPSSVVWYGSRCQAGACVTKTSSEVTNFAYDASISSGIIGSALAIEILLTGTFTPNLAAFVITAAVINLGWTGYSRDIGNYPSDSPLNRSQNAFAYIAGGFGILFAFSLLNSRRKEAAIDKLAVAVVSIIVAAVQFGLVAQLLNQHFNRTSDAEIDNDGSIPFNWSYIATIYAASVALAVAISILITDTYTVGFALFSLIVNLIALAWASKHHEYGTLNNNDFTKTSLAWQSFAIIAGVLALFINAFFVIRSSEKTAKAGAIGRVFALLIAIVFFVLIGLVASIFDKHFFIPSTTDRGSNMLIVAASYTDNYGNLVSPFAWPISIWTSSVVVAFALEVTLNGGNSGIAALAVTESANLIGWAANHVYFGSVIYSSLEGRTKAWEAVALTASVISFLFALVIVLSSAAPGFRSESATSGKPVAQPVAADFENPQGTSAVGGQE